ncbi:hypothetical protein C1X05_00130 [Laceyella sacchari]|uniref:Scaffolding protein n=1 Tax=Laceyella tengchongensis TaxID=574699 RepID=A0AA46AG74_9BACL|nr:hypothetical protein [Laceyella tengchongensis]AUS07419.1 hypothetical protein C1X05_00130 [Laceyella sacchari]SMP25178.1 hypothetical protein SAMN06265361_10523 [Laceyella tengchongensis]
MEHQPHENELAVSLESESKVFNEEYVKSLRAESAKYRTKAKEIKDQFEAFRQNVVSQLGISPDGDFEQQINQWKEKVQQSLLKAEVKSIAAELGIVDADAAFTLMSREGVEIGEDGSVKGVREALDALAQEKPYLIRQQAKEEQQPPSKGGQSFQENGNRRITREDLKRMPPEEVNRALAAGELNHLLNR